MSSPVSVVLEVTPQGQGLVLDIAGGRGGMRSHLQDLGYRYVNLDIQRFEDGEPSVIADAHALPFGNACFDLVVCKDALSCFVYPGMAVNEVYRVLKPDGLFVLVAGFMAPLVRQAEFYRFSPLALCHLLRDFEILQIGSPLSVFTMLSALPIEVLKRLHLGFTGGLVRRASHWLDRNLNRVQKRPSSFAAVYRVVARKPR